MKTPKEIKSFLNNKVLANINYTSDEIINGNLPKVETISIDDFLEWFENKPKKENQDIITFEGKEYEFIESTWGNCCINCDLGELDNCTLFPRICCSDNRRDRKEGYFKLIKPKNLGLIPYEFYYLKRDHYSWVIQFKEFIVDDNAPISYYYMLKIDDNTLNYNWSCINNGWIKATPAQKQQLIDKVQEETGKVWNEDTKMFEDKPKDILVPENIKIGRYNGNLLSLFFNNNKQYLMFSINQQTYIVQSADGYEKAFKCKLIPFKYEELQEGDIFFDGDIDSKENFANLENYTLKIGENKNFFAHKDEIRSVFYTEEPIVYKVVTIQ